ncbi:MAG: hypothetical protein KDD45_00720 [Bdellovibrionales bacterium]|nr:hypothetical protein [Bdellovibrionales bacterium]
MNLFVYVIIYLSPLIIKKKLEEEMKDKIIIFIDHSILSIQSGLSVRPALVKSLAEFDGWIKTQLSLMINNLINGKDSNQFNSKIIKKFYGELLKIEKSKVKILEQLKNFRQQLKMEQNLRRRSRQVTMNLKIQSLIMTIMYLGVSFFVYSNFDTSILNPTMLISIFMFAVGQLMIFLIGRKIKWKI